MKNIVKKSKCYVPILFGISIVLLFTGCGKDPDTADSKVGSSAKVLTDQPVEEYRADLLNLAYNTASKIPQEPHIKVRSKYQQMVVEGALKMDQPLKAKEYTEGIANWRRGMCFAHLAYYCAENGFAVPAEQYMEVARQIALIDHGQEWRNQRILSRISAAEKKMNANQDAGHTKSEVNKPLSAEEFEKQISALDELLAVGNLDTTIASLETYAVLYKSEYTNPDRRMIIEEKVKNSWDPVPIFVRIKVLLDLGEGALENSDLEHAQELANQCNEIIENASWQIGDQIAIVATVAGFQGRAGGAEAARMALNEMKSLYFENKESIMNLYRADCLRPLAKAYKAIGDEETALSLYREAVEGGSLHGNSRPRAEDLTETALSMALNGVQPDPELWTRMNEIYEGLGNRW